MSDDQKDLLDMLALTRVDHVGPVMARRLLDAFKSPAAVFAATERELSRIEGVGPKTVKSLRKGPDLKFAERQIEIAAAKGYMVIPIDSSVYPERLRHIYDPPTVLFVRGTLIESDSFAVAMVGSRRATQYGANMAESVALGLASAGATVISGLARGIDSICHRAALRSGGRTIGVLGCGVDVVYPPENAKLYGEIEANGAVVSELPFGTAPEGQHFPKRNRIIAGLSIGVVVVEAGSKSGALLTAKHALEQNREVFAIPGNITSAMSTGTNSLIKQGAHLVTSAEDVLMELQLMLPGRRGGPEPLPVVTLSIDEKTLFDAMSDEPEHVDILSRRTGVEVSRLLGLLLEMELKGAVSQAAGKRFVKSRVTSYNG
jgi:DNA processing protein